LQLVESDNLFESMQSMADAADFSASLRTLALTLIRIANDFRLLASGPSTGFDEIRLPAVQPGSSIMPGKVNPVIAESATMVAAQVIGNDATIAIAGQSGNFELNVMLPVIAYNLVQSIEILGSASANLADQCVFGLEATERGPELVEQGLMLATALAPEVGYDKAAEISKEAYKTGKTIREVARENTDLSEVELDKLLDAKNMTEV
jgi:fumarate hydratase class II